MNPDHRRVVILRIATGHIRAHVTVEAILFDQVDAVLRNPVTFLIAGKKRTVPVHGHAVGGPKSVSDAPALGAIFAHLDDRAVMRHQPVLRVAGGLSKIKVPLGIRL